MKKFEKKYLNFVLLLAILLSAGCTKQLEEKPQGIVAPSTFYKSDGDFQAAINGCLKLDFQCFSGHYSAVLMFGGQDYTSRQTAPELLYYDNYNPIATEMFTIYIWSRMYKSIVGCNDIITNLSKVSSVSDANKKLYEAQARFLRALNYFYLTRLYGEVQIITSENYTDAVNMAQSPVADIYALIIQDLTFAETNLPLIASAVPMPSRGAAKAMLADVYLTMAGWPLKDASKYALARDKAKEVMDMNIYSLQPHFGDLWLVANKYTSKELIFIFNGIAGTTAAGGRGMSIRPGEEGGWNNEMSEIPYFNKFPAGPRKDYTFWTVFADAKHTIWQNSTIGRPYISKFRDTGAGGGRDQGRVTSNSGDGYWVIKRYAEILLIYAEAANQAENGPSKAATDAINLVRRRAGESQTVYADLPYGMTKAAFDNAVYDERLWEFGFEFQVWFDEVRKERVVADNIANHPDVKVSNAWIPKPQQDIDLCPGLIQNIGY